jgi:glycosyltransferase involved in cell wall biosynthesis
MELREHRSNRGRTEVSTRGIGTNNGRANALESQPLRIGLIAPPVAPIPPEGYAGTERIIAVLAEGLHARGHDVTVFASGDSDVPCELVPVMDRSAWARGLSGTLRPLIDISVARAWRECQRFDVINAHVETAALQMGRHSGVPVVSTFHQRLDADGVSDLLDEFQEAPLIAISDSQRRWHPRSNWVATIHHGLDFSRTPAGDQPGNYLLLVGRVAPEKGVREAIDVARRTGRKLVMAAKMREPEEIALFKEVVEPAITAGTVDWRGEVAGAERDRLMASALATLMLGSWPEPFGLVAIESMATGTPVIARRAGGCTETIEHGVTGFLVDDQREACLAIERVTSLSRPLIRARARERFSADRMVDGYEAAFRKVISAARVPGSTDVAPTGGLDLVPPARIAAQHGLPRPTGRRPQVAVPELT